MEDLILFDFVFLISFSERGFALAQKIAEAFDSAKVFRSFGENRVPCEKIAEMAFSKSGRRLLIFVGAAGIAVRKIAPFLQDKTRDPAVVCVDERGFFAIPILSGHIGGANEAAKKIARQIGATAAITTATDANGVFSIDEWAAQNGFAIENPAEIKKIAKIFLSKKTVRIFAESNLNREKIENLFLEKQIQKAENAESADAVILDSQSEIQNARSLNLVKKNLFLGIGAKRGISAESLEDFVRGIFEKNHLRIFGIKAICSIDKKSDENAIVLLSKKLGVPFLTFSADELNAVSGDFSESDFVKKTVGTPCVCERAAVCASKNPTLILKKTSSNGITIAVSKSNHSENRK